MLHPGRGPVARKTLPKGIPMNVSQVYGAMSRVLLLWVSGRLPAPSAQLVCDILTMRQVLEAVELRLRRLAMEGDG